jgi:predicted flap endonuclease-1-like 5' DNA nuclease
VTMGDNEPRGTELTPRIGRAATAALTLAGYATYASLTRATAKDLLAIHGVGPKAVRILEEELAERGLAFRR